MDAAPGTAHRLLMQEIASALRSGAGGAELADLVVRTGWQTRPAAASDSIVLQGVLGSGRLVPVEIRRAASRGSA
ncbi:hypothetical protein [Amnibacterium kyonggiense]